MAETKVPAAQFKPSSAWGATAFTTTGMTTSEVDVGGTVTITLDVVSTVYLKAYGTHEASNANGVNTMRLKEGSTTHRIQIFQADSATQRKSFMLGVKLTGVSVGSHTYKLSGQMNANTGNIFADGMIEAFSASE